MFAADLHIHSRFSRATSRNLNLMELDHWARRKGLAVLGTGDLTHPGWLAEIEEQLEPADEGVYRLKSEFLDRVEKTPGGDLSPTYFTITGEVSSIYKRDGKVRKVHSVLFAPDFKAARRIQKALAAIGNIESDGRPILGLDVRDLLKIVLDEDDGSYLVPAHIWTPWFSMLGSKSGFDSVEECFGDLTKHIFALETGLSSDPAMNWRLSQLDGYTLVSNSDAHSASKLGREANLFSCEMTFAAMKEALRTGEKFEGTVEFFPEEGKYHLDGHRKCRARLDPGETVSLDGKCPVCGKAVTVGVMNRVLELADRAEGEKPDSRHPYYSLVPLPEVLGELLGVGPASKKVSRAYDEMLQKAGSELDILMNIPVDDITDAGGELLGEGIRRMRGREVIVEAGYDGEYGTIRLFEPGEKEKMAGQLCLLADPPPTSRSRGGALSPPSENGPPCPPVESTAPSVPAKKAASPQPAESGSRKKNAETRQASASQPLNTKQTRAVTADMRPLIVVAGPGTGKTRTLTHRISHLESSKQVRPGEVTAVTFTNRAADEMEHRLKKLMKKKASKILVRTFHALAMDIISQHSETAGAKAPVLLDDDERIRIIRSIEGVKSEQTAHRHADRISWFKQQLAAPGDLPPENERIERIYTAYEEELRSIDKIDVDDLIPVATGILRTEPGQMKCWRKRSRILCIDEFQDVNRAQYELLRILKPEGKGLMVIGDPDQAIYGFRGADRKYFLEFEQHYPDAIRVELTENYRSTKEIQNASAEVIGKPGGFDDVFSTGGHSGPLSTGGHSGPPLLRDGTISPVRLLAFTTDAAEAEFVAHSIEQLLGGTSFFSHDTGRLENSPGGSNRRTDTECSFGDIAVLCRSRAAMEPLKQAFSRLGIPFTRSVTLSVFESPAVKTLIDRIGYACGRLDGDTLYAEIISDCDPADAVDRLAAHEGLMENAQKSDRRALGELAKIAVQSRSVAELYDRVLLAMQDECAYVQPDRVALITLHASKGTEFNHVFITGCEQGLIPLYYGNPDEADLEEELRLLYVGMTRAKTDLTLTWAGKRALAGFRPDRSVSVFLEAVPSIVHEEARLPGGRKRKGRQLEIF